MLVMKKLEYAYVSSEKMFWLLLMLVKKIFLTSPLFDLVKILGNVGQNMTTAPQSWWLRDVPE